MTFDVIVHKDLSLNDVMYVIEHGKVCCLNYDARKTFGISVKQDDEFIGDDIAMLVRFQCPVVSMRLVAIARRRGSFLF